MKTLQENAFSGYEVELDTCVREKISLRQVWNNHPPALHWCIGFTCLSLGFVYALLFIML